MLVHENTLDKNLQNHKTVCRCTTKKVKALKFWKYMEKCVLFLMHELYYAI
jgi:hypothetical protein